VLANQDGGAHVDPKLDADYVKLRNDTMGRLFGAPPNPGATALEGAIEGIDWKRPDTNVVKATMRQIAHEAIRDVERHFPSLAAFRWWPTLP